MRLEEMFPLFAPQIQEFRGRGFDDDAIMASISDFYRRSQASGVDRNEAYKRISGQAFMPDPTPFGERLGKAALQGATLGFYESDATPVESGADIWAELLGGMAGGAPYAALGAGAGAALKGLGVTAKMSQPAAHLAKWGLAGGTAGAIETGAEAYNDHEVGPKDLIENILKGVLFTAGPEVGFNALRGAKAARALESRLLNPTKKEAWDQTVAAIQAALGKDVAENAGVASARDAAQRVRVRQDGRRLPGEPVRIRGSAEQLTDPTMMPDAEPLIDPALTEVAPAPERMIEGWKPEQIVEGVTPEDPLMRRAAELTAKAERRNADVQAQRLSPEALGEQMLRESQERRMWEQYGLDRAWNTEQSQPLRQDLVNVLQQVAAKKGIPPQDVQAVLESAVVAAKKQTVPVNGTAPAVASAEVAPVQAARGKKGKTPKLTPEERTAFENEAYNHPDFLVDMEPAARGEAIAGLSDKDLVEVVLDGRAIHRLREAAPKMFEDIDIQAATVAKEAATPEVQGKVAEAVASTEKRKVARAKRAQAKVEAEAELNPATDMADMDMLLQDARELMGTLPTDRGVIDGFGINALTEAAEKMGMKFGAAFEEKTVGVLNPKVQRRMTGYELIGDLKDIDMDVAKTMAAELKKRGIHVTLDQKNGNFKVSSQSAWDVAQFFKESLGKATEAVPPEVAYSVGEVTTQNARASVANKTTKAAKKVGKGRTNLENPSQPC